MDKYKVSNDTFYRQQLYSAGDCDTSIVGQYKLIQEEDIMRFEEIADGCEGRGEDIEGLVYTSLAYSPFIDSSSHINNFSIEAHESIYGVFSYQNNSLISELPEYRLYDVAVAGKEQARGKIYSTGQIILRDFEDGTYFLSILWQFGSETFKLFKLRMTSVLEPNTPASYSIYPNPSPSGIFTYENQTDSFQSPYRIYSGQLLQSGELGARGEIDISGVASGVYYMMIEGKGQQEVLKLVK